VVLCGTSTGLWPDHLKEWSIAVEELFPVVVTVALYRPQWRRKIVQFLVDNLAVVQVFNSNYSSSNHLMHLICLLVFLASYHNFWFSSMHIAGKKNLLADTLSQNNLHFFHLQVPKAPPNQPRIPPALISLLSQNLMDIDSLDRAVQRYYSAALTPSTKKTYKAAEKKYAGI